MGENPKTLAYGLLETTTGKLLLTNVYARQQVAEAAAERMTGRHKTYVAIPLIGPDDFAKLVAITEASTRAETALRNEMIGLRNQLAERRGKVVAEAHAQGLPAPPTAPHP